MNYRERYQAKVIKKAIAIKAIICDVDGVLTDGRIIYDDTGKEIKHFNVKDGLIVSYLKKAGIITGVITGRDSEIVSRRCAELRLDFCHQGILDKLSVVEKLAKHYNLKAREIAFIGDDINDLPVFRYVGLSVCPADAFDYIKTEADWTTAAAGGNGVFREVADLILASQGTLEKMLHP